jgi:hypothetical protein
MMRRSCVIRGSREGHPYQDGDGGGGGAGWQLAGLRRLGRDGADLGMRLPDGSEPQPLATPAISRW